MRVLIVQLINGDVLTLPEEPGKPDFKQPEDPPSNGSLVPAAILDNDPDGTVKAALLEVAKKTVRAILQNGKAPLETPWCLELIREMAPSIPGIEPSDIVGGTMFSL